VVTSKKLNTFKKKEDLDAVRDLKMREALKALWDGVVGGASASTKQQGEFAQKAWTEGVKLGSRTFKVRSVRVTENTRVIPIKDDRSGRAYKAYRPGGNEFADLWEMPEPSRVAPVTPAEAGARRRRRRLKPGEREWRLVVISTFEANQPGFNAANRRPHPQAKHIARLHINDMCALGTGSQRKIVRVCKIAVQVGKPFVYFAEHREANVDGRVRKGEIKYLTKSAKQLFEEGFRKVGVDEIGRVRDPGPRSPQTSAAAPFPPARE
jgi:CRISPR-associated endonuclease Csn1